MATTSIIDTPRLSSEGDSFGIDSYKEGLTHFINLADTPLTIALQGEWGSGKTSLMNTLEKDLSEGDGRYTSVWLNTWEFALMRDAESALVEILKTIVSSIIDILGEDTDFKTKFFGKLARGLGRAAATVALTQANKVADGVAQSIADEFSSVEQETIKSLRDDLENLIGRHIQNSEKKGIIFFVDDLDRIDPPVAVQLLELLKNIFSIKHCIFVLAIDYDVVVKGLEPKFGKLTEKNEREFRSFFDKIIQLPFTMPVASYNIDSFLTDSLQQIGYIEKRHAKEKKLLKFLSTTAGQTVGTNPRALKRLLNALSLINCINIAKGPPEETPAEEENPDLDLQVNFALVAIQVAYPPIYRFIHHEPDFVNWNAQTALELQLPPLSDEERAKIALNPEFDEDWEQVVFQACQNDHYLKQKALSISRVLNSLKDIIIEQKEGVGDIISNVISQSSVTSLEAPDAANAPEYHRGHLLKHVRHHLMEELKKRLPERSDWIRPIGKRVQIHARFDLDKKTWEHWMEMYSTPFEGKVRLRIKTCYDLLPAHSIEQAYEKLDEQGFLETFHGVRQASLETVHPQPKHSAAFTENQCIFIHNKHFTIQMGFCLDLPSPESFHQDVSYIPALADEVIKIFSLRQKLDPIWHAQPENKQN